MIRNMLEAIAAEGRYLRAGEAEALGSTLLDAICSIVTPLVDAGSEERCPRTALQVYRRAIRYIEELLADPALSSQAIAKDCHGSVRYLQIVFSRFSTTVAGFIREQRLQGCRRSLLSEQLGARAIQDIALDWGFDDHPTSVTSTEGASVSTHARIGIGLCEGHFVQGDIQQVQSTQSHRCQSSSLLVGVEMASTFL